MPECTHDMDQDHSPGGRGSFAARAVAEDPRDVPAGYATPVAHTGGESVVVSHTLIPQAMHHAFALLAVLMQPGLPLERRHHEMIATVVSAANRCFY